MRGSPPDPPGGDILSESSSIAAWRTVYHRFRNRSGRPRGIRPDLHLVTSMVEPGAMAQDYGAERETACAELHDYGAERWRKVIGSCDYGTDWGESGVLGTITVRNGLRGQHTTNPVIAADARAKSATPPPLLHHWGQSLPSPIAISTRQLWLTGRCIIDSNCDF